MQAVLSEFKTQLAKGIEHLKHEFSKLRTGRANTALFEEIRADAYGTPTPLKNLGNITVVDSSTVTITPWDKSLLGAIEKAVSTSEYGFNPVNDGQLIRIPMPKPSMERRKELAKLAKKIAEDTKVLLRNHRHKALEALKKLEKDKAITQDDVKRGETEVQKALDAHVKQIDDVLKAKEKEITEI